MSDERLMALLGATAPAAPDGLWNRIRRDVARTVAQDLLASLEQVTNPVGSEARDRKNACLEHAYFLIRKGA